MRQLFIIFLCFTSISLLAQTKEIAFKSHSGNMDNFKIAIGNKLFGSKESNFGLPSDIKTYHLDSVIYISETKAVVIQKVYSRAYHEPKDSARFLSLKRDTVLNDPLFARKHSLDSIRRILKKTGHYSNPVNEVIFIGYDNKKNSNKSKGMDADNKPKENTIIPVVSIDNTSNNSPFDSKFLLMLGTILMLSLLGGWFSWKFYRPELREA